MNDNEPRHCDDVADDLTQPEVLRNFLNWARSPAHGMTQPPPWPKLFADYNGQRVQVVMASRFGDVGITKDLSDGAPYKMRVSVEDLTNFGDTP